MRARAAARRAAGLAGYLRDPLERVDAAAEVRRRLAGRESRFVELVGPAIFGRAGSPYAAVLRWAGWDAARLARAVERDGLPATLAALRDAGVRLSAREFKGREPIRRDGLLVEPRGGAFENPLLPHAALSASTSGSAGAPTAVAYDWSLFRDEAPLELLLLEAHDAIDVPHALWLPAPPGIAGLHNVLVHLRFRRPPERWFSQLAPRRRDAPALRYLQATARLAGMRVPLPEAARLDDAARVVDWLVRARDRAGRAVLKTYASSATRVAEEAQRRGVELDGCLLLAGGEPLTERRVEHVERSGASVFGRYVATETGWIAGACPHGPPGAMHLYADRLAAVPGDVGPGHAGPLLFTSLTASAPKVLLNVDVGDAGLVSARPCPCPLGRAGLETELSGVHGHDKVSSAGTTVAAATLERVLDELALAAGAPPDSYSLWEEEGRHGDPRLVVLVGPDVPVDEETVRERVLERLAASGPEGALAARLWRESGAIEIRRGRPSTGAVGKPVVPARR